jgi:hypothetical protein
MMKFQMRVLFREAVAARSKKILSQVAFKIRLPSFLYHVLVRRIVRVALTMLRSLRLSIESRGQKLSTK